VIGRTLDGRYRLLRLIGAGGMGSVYEAEHSDTGRRLAIKILAAADAARDASLVARFEQEARAAGSLETPHVARALDAGVDIESGAPYMAMELLSGEDAYDLVHRKGPLDPALALRIVAQACLGLREAHREGIIHRDIKSANLFLARGEAGSVTVKILDFGLAKASLDAARGQGTNSLTRTGTILGSPLFMAPEQARGARDADERSDLWSIGIVLYHLLTGQIPRDDIDGLGELIITICSEPPPRVRDVAPWVPPEVAAIVEGALVIDPSGRFQRADDMLAAIARLLPSGFAITESMLLSAGEAQRPPPPAPTPAPIVKSDPPPIARSSTLKMAALPIAPVQAPVRAASLPSPVPPDPYAAPSSSPPAPYAIPPSPSSPPDPYAAPSSPPPQQHAPVSTFGTSDQGVVRPTIPPPAKRRALRAPLVLLAAAAAGVILGVGLFRIAPPSSARASATLAPIAPSPDTAVAPPFTSSASDSEGGAAAARRR
jgi:serine/threonine-protein kinase